LRGVPDFESPKVRRELKERRCQKISTEMEGNSGLPLVRKRNLGERGGGSERNLIHPADDRESPSNAASTTNVLGGGLGWVLAG